MPMRDKKAQVKAVRKWEKDNPERFKAGRKARAKVNNAVRDGRAKKPTKDAKCPNCGKKGFRKEYDHQGKKPGWKCSACHDRGNAA